ncbi:MAG: hypothetical protein IKQ70_02450 [Bacteroidales bacterium]|nr:hypothetical protein [Bacteroidales bacterium]
MFKNLYDTGCFTESSRFSAVGEPFAPKSLSCKKKSYDDDDDDFDDNYDDYSDEKFDDDFDKDFDDDDLDINIDEYVGDLDDMLDENGDFITDEGSRKSKKSSTKRGKKVMPDDEEEEEDDDDDLFDDDFADFQDNFIPNDYDDDISLDKYIDDENYGGNGGGYYDDQY